MAGLEVRLISNVLKSKDFKPLLTNDLTEADFQTTEGKEWFKFLKTTYKSKDTYGEVPSLDRFKRRFPSFPYAPTSDSTSALVLEMVEANIVTDGHLMVEEAQDYLEEGDYEAAFATMQEFLSFWNKRRAEGGDIVLARSGQLLREQYDIIKNSSGMLGIPWPWDPCNEETLGMQGGQLIVLYGRPKSMKTWVALVIAVHAYLYHNARVLFYSREMSREQLLRRAASIISGLDYRDVKRAKLAPTDEKELFAALDMLESSEGVNKEGRRGTFIISNDRGPSLGATMDLLKQKAADEQVDLLIIDAVYKLKDSRTKSRDSDWKTQANVIQDAKDVAVDLNIPVIAVTQANRKAGKKASTVDIGEVAFTDSVGQEADLLCRIIKGTDPHTKEPELVLAWPATRDEELEPFLIHALPGCNFDLKKRKLTAQDVADREAAEGKEDDDDGKDPGKEVRDTRSGAGAGPGAALKARRSRRKSR